MKRGLKGNGQNGIAPKTKGTRAAFETGMNILFFLCGAVAVLFVLFISIYLIISCLLYTSRCV